MNWETLTDDSELKHYGVKGMKWGVIREKTKNYTNSIRNAHASDRHDKILKKETKLSYKPANEKTRKKIQKLQAKRAELQETMKRSVKDLSPEQIERGKNHYKTGKAVAKALLKTSVSMLAGGIVGDIATNGGIRAVEEVVSRTVGARSATNGLGNPAVFTEISKGFVKVGRWAIEIPNSVSNRSYIDIITEVDKYGRAIP